MKRIISLILTVLIMFIFATVAFADDQQENFLNDMAAGLVERWNLNTNEKLTPEEDMDHRYRLTSVELDKIEKYQSVTFQNIKFDMLAKAYIEGCQLQRNSLKYYKDRQDLYILQWSTGMQQRTICLVGIYDYYGLDISDEMIKEFRSMLENSNTGTQNASSPMNYTVAAKDCFFEVISQEFDIKDPSSGLVYNEKDIRVTVKNISPMALSNLVLSIDLLDENNNIVDTKIGLASTMIQPNQSVTVSEFMLSEIPYAVKVSKYTCLDEAGNRYTGYVPDAPILIYAEP